MHRNDRWIAITVLIAGCGLGACTLGAGQSDPRLSAGGGKNGVDGGMSGGIGHGNDADAGAGNGNGNGIGNGIGNVGDGGVAPGKPNGMYMFWTFDGPGDHAGGTTVNAINEAGDILGFSASADGKTLTNFIRSRNGMFTTLTLGDPAAMAIGINARKDVVGGSGDNAIIERSNMRVVTPLAQALPGNTKAEVAFGINGGGAIVGQFTRTDTGASPGFLLADGKFTTINPPMAQATNAQGINDGGQVIGFFATAAAVAGPVIADNVAEHGFLFDSAAGTYTMLPDPQQPNLFLTQYLGINDRNQTVGYWQDMAGSQHGFRYDLQAKTFTAIDAPDAAAVAGVTVTQVVGINNAGDIAGFFIDAAGAQHGFFATPK